MANETEKIKEKLIPDDHNGDIRIEMVNPEEEKKEIKYKSYTLKRRMVVRR